MKDYSVLDKLVPQTEELHRAIFDDGYTQGYANGKEEAYKNPKSSDAYHRGLEDAWTTARKVCDTVKEKLYVMGLDIKDVSSDMDEYEFSCRVIGDNDVSEVIEKLKAYEEKQKEPEIAVGDEVIVRNLSGKAVVTALVAHNMCCVMCNDGETCAPLLRDCTRTGRHFGEVSKIIEAMQEGKE